jgi:hypothetical protein
MRFWTDKSDLQEHMCVCIDAGATQGIAVRLLAWDHVQGQIFGTAVAAMKIISALPITI